MKKKIILGIVLGLLLLTPIGVWSAGALMSTTLSAASTNATNVKSTAGRVYGLSLVNTNVTLHWVLLYDTAAAPTCNTDTIKFRVPLAQNIPVHTWYDTGIQFSNGISFCIATSFDGTGIATANAVAVNVVYF